MNYTAGLRLKMTSPAICARALRALMVQGKAFALRYSKCDAPGAGSLMEFVADRLQSNYKAVLLSRSSEDLSVVAEGIGTEIVPLVLAAAADGQFVWMKPQ
jgi:hypothetical protein